MKKIIYILYISVFLINIQLFNTFSQQLPVYSQYMLNSFLLNPAVAGHEGYTAFNLTGREQWVGLKDAPATFALSGQTRILRNSYIYRGMSVKRRRKMMSRGGRVGLGGYVFTDYNGAFNRTGFQFSYAYHLALRKSNLSFGFSLTGYQFRIDDKKVRLYEFDEFYYNTEKSALIPDANFGIYYSDPNLYAGISALQLFQNTFKLNDRDGASFKMVRHYYIMAGYRFEVSDFNFLEPSFLLKTTDKFISQLDLTMKLYLKQDYWAGISYRTGGSYSLAEESLQGGGSSIILMAGARIDKFIFGYAFDYTLSAIGKRTYGSHELMLGARFGDNARRYRWLNRY